MLTVVAGTPSTVYTLAPYFFCLIRLAVLCDTPPSASANRRKPTMPPERRSTVAPPGRGSTVANRSAKELQYPIPYNIRSRMRTGIRHSSQPSSSIKSIKSVFTNVRRFLYKPIHARPGW